MGLRHRWEMGPFSTETTGRLGTDRVGSSGRRRKQRTLKPSADKPDLCVKKKVEPPTESNWVIESREIREFVTALQRNEKEI